MQKWVITLLVLSGSGITGGGLSHPQAAAIDGAGRAWVVNHLVASVTELAPANSTVPGQALSPSAGWASDAGLSQPFGVAIDAGGSLWVTNFGNGTLTELVGVAAPVKTPLLGPVRVPWEVVYKA